MAGSQRKASEDGFIMNYRPGGVQGEKMSTAPSWTKKVKEFFG
jgi:hypothetical protein